MEDFCTKSSKSDFWCTGTAMFVHQIRKNASLVHFLRKKCAPNAENPRNGAQSHSDIRKKGLLNYDVSDPALNIDELDDRSSCECVYESLVVLDELFYCRLVSLGRNVLPEDDLAVKLNCDLD